jgi:phosphoenolpyruvate synthase/pyruvate phosphate dikinase
MKYIKPLTELRINNATEFGGKAASLGEMISGGIPVPPGFAISAAAYRELSKHPVSEDLKRELEQAFNELGAERVAVRSSALAEDAADASWAGQLETYLNVKLDNLTESVRKCWRSIDSDRAAIYASDHRISDDQRAVGVVVQAMLDSQVSGVMFTVHPVTKDKSSMVIESLYGLGEMIVQGTGTPDNFIVRKQPLEVTEFNIAVKDQMMIYRNGKNKVVDVDEEQADKATLREREVLQLAELGIKIENHYKKPQDIEWARVDKDFYILQSRPITTL